MIFFSPNLFFLLSPYTFSFMQFLFQLKELTLFSSLQPGLLNTCITLTEFQLTLRLSFCWFEFSLNFYYYCFSCFPIMENRSLIDLLKRTEDSESLLVSWKFTNFYSFFFIIFLIYFLFLCTLIYLFLLYFRAVHFFSFKSYVIFELPCS